MKNNFYVLRGGSWGDDPKHCKPSCRFSNYYLSRNTSYNNPGADNPETCIFYGFRVVAVPKVSTVAKEITWNLKNST